VNKSSEEFGSDVMQKINNLPVSSATGRMTYVVKIIQALSEFFETQNLAAVKNQKEFVKEFHDYVKSALDGDGQDMKGILENIKQYFWIQEFKRDPEKQRAIALFLKHYVTFIKDNVKTISVDDFLDISVDTPLQGRYFDKEKVFGDIIKLVKKYDSL
jgi:hypothetical protein